MTDKEKQLAEKAQKLHSGQPATMTQQLRQLFESPELQRRLKATQEALRTEDERRKKDGLPPKDGPQLIDGIRETYRRSPRTDRLELIKVEKTTGWITAQNKRLKRLDEMPIGFGGHAARGLLRGIFRISGRQEVPLKIQPRLARVLWGVFGMVDKLPELESGSRRGQFRDSQWHNLIAPENEFCDEMRPDIRRRNAKKAIEADIKELQTGLIEVGDKEVGSRQQLFGAYKWHGSLRLLQIAPIFADAWFITTARQFFYNLDADGEPITADDLKLALELGFRNHDSEGDGLFETFISREYILKLHEGSFKESRSEVVFVRNLFEKWLRVGNFASIRPRHDKSSAGRPQLAGYEVAIDRRRMGFISGRQAFQNARELTFDL